MAYFIVKIAGKAGFHIVDETGLDGITPDTPGITVSVLDVASNTEVTTSPGFADVGDLSIDPHPAMLNGVSLPVDGFVYGFDTREEFDAREKPVPFSGTADTAHNGELVEGRLITVDGLSLTGWQSLGNVTAGAYSGTITCPAVGPLAYKEVRIASAALVQRDFNRCRVAPIAYIPGRSQTSIPLQSWWVATSETATEVGPEPTLDPAAVGLVSYIGTGGSNTNTDGTTTADRERYGLVTNAGASATSIGYHTLRNIANQWAKLSPDMGLCIVANAHNSNVYMMPDARAEEMLGGQKCLIGTGRFYKSDVGLTEDHPKEVAQQIAYDDACQAVLADILSDDFVMVHSALSKGQSVSRYDADLDKTTEIQMYAGASIAVAGVVAPAMLAIRGQNHYSSAHPLKHDYRGTLYNGIAMPVAIARGLGIDDSENPYWRGAMFNQDRTVVTLEAVPVNGGEIYVDNPAGVKNLRLFNGSTWESATFSAAQSGNRVHLFKSDTSTPWPATARVFSDVGGVSAGGDADVETAMLHGTVFERWDGDLYGLGLAVTGGHDGSNWLGEYQAQPATWSNANEEFPTKASLQAYLAANAGRTSTKPLKVPGVDALPVGAYIDTGNIIKFSASGIYEFEDWDFRGYTIRQVSGANVIVNVRQSLFDNTPNKVANGNGAAIHINRGGIGIVEHCEFLSNGDYSLGGITGCVYSSVSEAAATAGAQWTIRHCIFDNWAADPISGPWLIVERNIFKITRMLPFLPEKWDSRTAYDVGDWVLYNNMAHRCIVANTGNAPTGVDSQNNTWWVNENPHCDLMTMRGSWTGLPSVIQYNLFDRSFADLKADEYPTRINANVWFINTDDTWEVTTYLRKNIMLNSTTYMGGKNLQALTGSKFIVEGNWMQPSNGYLTSGSGTWKWGANNYNYDTDVVIPTPAAAAAWP